MLRNLFATTTHTQTASVKILAFKKKLLLCNDYFTVLAACTVPPLAGGLESGKLPPTPPFFIKVQ